LARAQPLDVVIANAGVMACPQGKTQDGFETQFGTNHLGHFVLVNRLVPLLKSGARIVTLSSAGHQISDVDLEDPNFERTPYQPFIAYGRSKTANILHAVALDSRLKGRGVRATSIHPGGIHTELSRHLTPELMEVSRIINCTGGESDPAKSKDLMTQHLLADGLAQADPLRLGLMTDDTGALISADGAASKTIFTLGPLRRGMLWESTSIPEIRVQAAALAEVLLRELQVPDDSADNQPGLN